MTRQFAATFVLCALLVPGAAFAQGVFQTETADGAPQDVGQFSSLELDVSGSPHVTYYDATSGDLRYANKAGGVWTIETPDAEGDIGSYTSLVVTHGGQVHTAYYATTTGAVKYANRIGGAWTIEVVDDPVGEVGRWASLALDPTSGPDNPHIAYYDGATGDLKYAAREGGSWTIVSVPAAEDIGSFGSLAIDPTGRSHISCYDATNGNLLYVTKPAGSWTWTVETADGSANNVGRFTSITIDEGGNPHVSYYDVTAADLLYARRVGGVWTVESPDVTPDDVGRYTSIALNAEGDPRISYFDITTTGLKFARRGNGTWVVQSVGGYEPTPGRFTSLELDALGGPWIAFHGDDVDDQVIAHFAPDSLSFGGRLHFAIGDAGLDSTDDAIVVDQIGESGQDGVTVLHEAAGGFNTKFEDLNALTDYPLGAFLQLSTGATPLSSFEGDDLSEVTGSCRLTDVEGPVSGTRRLQVKADFNDVGSPTSTLELYLEGDLVFSQSGIPDSVPVVETEDWLIAGGSVLIVENRAGGGTANVPAFSLQGLTGASVLIVELGKAAAETTIMVDEIRIIAEAPAESVLSYSKFTLWGKDLGNFTIKDEELVPAIQGGLVTGVGASPIMVGQPLVVYPNPSFGGTVNVLFRLSESRSVDLAIFDATGRRIRSLGSGVLPAGVRSLAWDGRDDAGRPVSAGAYFLRLDSGAEKQAGRLMLIR